MNQPSPVLGGGIDMRQRVATVCRYRPCAADGARRGGGVSIRRLAGRKAAVLQVLLQGAATIASTGDLQDHAAETIPPVGWASAEPERIQLTNRMIASWSAMAANSTSSACRKISIEALPIVRHYGCCFDGTGTRWTERGRRETGRQTSNELFRDPFPIMPGRLGQLSAWKRCARRCSSAVAPVTSHDDSHAEEGSEWRIDDAERHRCNETTPKSDLHHGRRNPRVDQWDDVTSWVAARGRLWVLLRSDRGQALPSSRSWGSGWCGHGDLLPASQHPSATWDFDTSHRPFDTPTRPAGRVPGRAPTPTHEGLSLSRCPIPARRPASGPPVQAQDLRQPTASGGRSPRCPDRADPRQGHTCKHQVSSSASRTYRPSSYWVADRDRGHGAGRIIRLLPLRRGRP